MRPRARARHKRPRARQDAKYPAERARVQSSLFSKKGVDFCVDFFFQKRPRGQQDAKYAARRARGRVSPTDKTKPSRSRWSTAPHHIAPLGFFLVMLSDKSTDRDKTGGEKTDN